MVTAKIKQFINARIRRCRKALAERSLDALIIADPVDVTYLTGFSGEDSVLVLTAKRKFLVTDSRFDEQVRQECSGLAMSMRQGPMSSAVASVLERILPKPKKASGKKKDAGQQVGIESESITVAALQGYKKAIGKILKTTENVVRGLRVCKDEDEISKIRQAVRVAEQSILEVLDWIEPGKNEQEVAAYLNYQMERRSGGAPAFGTIVAYGSHASQAHARPGKARLTKCQNLLFDWGATVNGYRSDLTRCYVTGRIRPAFGDAYKWVLESQLAAIEEIRPGVEIRRVDEAARNVLKKAKLPIYGHGTGHGIGLDIHEAPSLYGRNEAVLEEGMVITIEPGVYIPGKFGIRIEDDVLVTARGKRVLSRLDKKLQIIG